MAAPQRTLVLDAMGVLYSVGDDVAELLCPFISEKLGEHDRSRVEALYREASLGTLSAEAFWRAVHLDPSLEDEYLVRHQLSAGIVEFLQQLPAELASVWCLTNDVAAWSRKLRSRFGLDRLIDGFVVSAEVGARKPDPAIFRHFFARSALDPHEMVFVDDREANLDAARRFGMETILFSCDGSAARHPVAAGFDEVRRLIEDKRSGA